MEHNYHKSGLLLRDDTTEIEVNDKAPENDREVKSMLRTGGQILLGAVALGYSLIYLRFILVPLVFSRFLVYIFQPFINLLVGKRSWPLFKFKIKMPRWSAIVVSMVLIITIVAILGFIIAFSVLEVLRDFDTYEEGITEVWDSIVSFVQSYGYTEQQLLDLLQLETLLTNVVMSVVSYIFSFIPNAFLVLLFTLYMLVDYENQNKSDFRYYIDKQIRKYIIIKIIMATITALLIGIVLKSIGANLALLFAFLSFILSFVPNIGGLIATLLPLPFVILEPSQTVTTILIAALVPFLIQVVLSNIIEPKIIAKQMHLPFITVLVCLLFWGYIWGIVGAMVSVPVTVLIRTYLLYIDHPLPRFLAAMIVGDFSALISYFNK